jgi:hypothetical protein
MDFVLCSQPHNVRDKPNHQMKKIIVLDRYLHVFCKGRRQYILGNELSQFVGKKCFNMYRSLRKQGVRIRRASPEEFEYIKPKSKCLAGVHSYTLIPVLDALQCIASAVYGDKKKSKRKKKLTHLINVG